MSASVRSLWHVILNVCAVLVPPFASAVITLTRNEWNDFRVSKIPRFVKGSRENAHSTAWHTPR